MKPVKIVVRKHILAECECGFTIKPQEDDSFKISLHLVAEHNFRSDTEIKYELVGEVICPPMLFMEAGQN